MLQDLVTPEVTAAVQRLDSLLAKVTNRRRIFIATWRTGGNFGDDYLARAMESFVRRSAPGGRIVHTNLYLDSYRTNPEDLLIVGGGGVWGAKGNGRLDRSLYRAWMSARCPLALANISFESFDPLAGEQLKELASKAELFSVRDEASWTTASRILGDGRVLFAADTSYLDPIRVERSPVPGRIGVNVCNPAQGGGVTVESFPGIADGIARLRDLGYGLRCVAMRNGGPSPDYLFCRKIDPSCPEAFSPDVFRECELFIGIRFHSVLLALQNRIPVIAIACTQKVRRLMQEYRLEEFCLEPGEPEFGARLRSLVEAVDEEKMIAAIADGNRRAEARLVPFTEQLRGFLQRQ